MAGKFKMAAKQKLVITNPILKKISQNYLTSFMDGPFETKEVFFKSKMGEKFKMA
jgi:hypothetical protein